MQIFLHGMWAAENPLATIPEFIIATTACPDMVIIERKDVTLIEFAIPPPPHQFFGKYVQGHET